MPTIATPAALGVTTANILKIKAASTDDLGKAVTPIILKESPEPLTKTQKAKLKKQEKAAKIARAKVLAEQQKQDRERAATSSKSSESSISPDETPFAIEMDISEDTAHTSNTADSSQTTTSFALVPDNISDDDALSTRAKKILAKKRKKNLVDSGVGVVVTKKTPDIRKRHPVKKVRQVLTKDDKVKHKLPNPAAHLIHKHKDDSIALNSAWDRFAEEKAIRIPQRPHSVQIKRTNPQNDTAMQRIAALTQVDSTFVEDHQDDSQDDSTGRAMTIASSDSDDDEMPESVSSPTSLVDDELHTGLSGANGPAYQLGEHTFSDSSSEFEEFPDEKVDADKIDARLATPRNAPRVQIIAPTPHYDDEITMEGSHNGFAMGDYGDSPPPRASPYGFTKTLDVLPQPEDVVLVQFENAIEDNTNPPIEDATTTTIDDVAKLEIDQGPSHVTSEELVKKVTEAPSWVSGLLSLPNATCYPPTLTRERELALIKAHVTPLYLPDSKQKSSKAEKKAANTLKVATMTLEAVDDVIVSTTTESIMPEEPAASEMTSGNENEHVSMETSLSAVDKLEFTPATATETSSFVARMLLLPNGEGQTAAARELHELLVATHVAPLHLPVPRKQKAKKVAPLSMNTSAQTDAALPLEEPTHAETPIDEISELVLDAAPESELKIAEEDTTISPSDGDSKSRRSHRHVSRSSKTTFPSSRTSSARSNTSLNDLERKTHKARNTYLGTASLEDFVNNLEFDHLDGTTFKAAICETFAALSADEMEAIQSKRPIQDQVNFDSAYAQRRIKLGTTTLYAFLRGIDFDDEGVTTVVNVMRSFKNAANQALQPSTKLANAFYLELSAESGCSRQSARSRRSSGSGSGFGSSSEL